MAAFGIALSSEEHPPQDLVRFATRAESAGFSFAMLSDHFHPWLDTQGQSPFAGTVIGAISQTTRNLILGMGVTCPIMRYHPAIIAQAAATAQQLMAGRFFLGVGTGENLNEHIVGLGWPPIHIRQRMLEEAVMIIQLLWTGTMQSYYGEFFTLENARLYSLPDEPPALMIAASGPKSAAIAGKISDGLITTSPDSTVLQSFDTHGGRGKPRIGQLTVCVARHEQDAVNRARRIWPNGVIKGQLSQELALPSYFKQATSFVTDEGVRSEIVCGSNPEKHIAGLKRFTDAGFTHVYIHNVGENQEEFFQFYEKEILPNVESLAPQKRGRGRPRKIR